mgnify:FL=1|jgi:hypothetical protein
MPKYYVQDGYEKAVIDAPSPEDAVLKAVLNYFSTFIVNGFYIVSERGFEVHKDCEEDEDDLIFDSNYILDLIAKKKDEKDGEDT